ncbi:MAG: nucleotidyltransferase family protein [Desulfobacterales bacterium]
MDGKEEILFFLRQHKKELEERFSVRRIGLFGSFVHGADNGGSDVDIFVELGQPTFDHYMDLKFFLEDSLGRPVDLVLADSLKPRLKSVISNEIAYA